MIDDQQHLGCVHKGHWIVELQIWPGQTWLLIVDDIIMMTSSNGYIFRVTGHFAGNSPVPGELPAQRPVTRSFDVFFDVRLNKRLSKQSWGWWFETLSCPWWRHCNGWQKFTYHWPSVGESTGNQWIPFTQRAGNAELCFFFVEQKWTNSRVADDWQVFPERKYMLI